MSRFDYILTALETTPFEEEPFRHIYIEDLFAPDDFAEIVRSPAVDLPVVDSDKALFAHLGERGYKAIEFPGCTTDLDAYMRWHAEPHAHGLLNQPTCEGFGVAMRLNAFAPGSVLAEVREFFTSEALWRTMAGRFGVEYADVNSDFGIQKYLDGYEISPHPDIRRKALTFMVNINPSPAADQLEIHTHYMKFVPEREYIRDYWASKKEVDRAWVPWPWCASYKQQRKNNSMVFFAPSDDTLHAIKTRYDHLLTQRTQLYGNLWHNHNPARINSDFRALEALEPAKAPA